MEELTREELTEASDLFPEPNTGERSYFVAAMFLRELENRYGMLAEEHSRVLLNDLAGMLQRYADRAVAEALRVARDARDHIEAVELERSRGR